MGIGSVSQLASAARQVYQAEFLPFGARNLLGEPWTDPQGQLEKGVLSLLTVKLNAETINSEDIRETSPRGMECRWNRRVGSGSWWADGHEDNVRKDVEVGGKVHVGEKWRLRENGDTHPCGREPPSTPGQGHLPFALTDSHQSTATEPTLLDPTTNHLRYVAVPSTGEDPEL